MSFTDTGCSLPTFETWMSWPGKNVTLEEKRVQMREIVWNGESCFLKVCAFESAEFAMRQWLHGRRAISSPELEAINLIALQKAGFDVVPVPVAGTAYQWGKISQGFLVTRAVNGIGLDQDLLMSTNARRRELLQCYGRLIARLHRLNYYESLRCTDVLVDDDRLVLLDRTTLPVMLNLLGRSLAVRKSILRGAYRNRRVGVKLDVSDIDNLCAGYANVDPGMVNVIRKALLAVYTASIKL